MITYRVLTASDYEEISALWKNTDGMGLRSFDDSKEGIEKYLARNPFTSFAAIDEDRIVGCILCGHDGRRGFIYHTCVMPEYRGRGIGKALVNHALSALRCEGINKAALVCFSGNDCGNGFWSAEGWELRRDLNYYDLNLNTNNI